MLNIIKCPHCKKPGISLLHKFFLGTPTTCKQCGNKAGEKLLESLYILLPFIPVFIFTGHLSLIESLPYLLAAYFVASTMKVIFKPLHPVYEKKKEKPETQDIQKSKFAFKDILYIFIGIGILCAITILIAHRS